jgi:hypothetical protein
MLSQSRNLAVVASFLLAIAFLVSSGSAVFGQEGQAEEASIDRESPMNQEGKPMSRAEGTFEVQLTPQEEGAGEPGGAPGRMVLDKTFEGDLQATSRGQMLTAMTATPGSAGYVAMEQVTGKLAGREGSFVLQHSGTMTEGQQRLSIEVVPRSGTGELEGLTGTMEIRIDEGQHFYLFEYALP